MKKILALLLASLLLIGLFAGCAKQETAPVQQEQTTTTEPAPAERAALKDKIRRLLKEKNAVMVSHYYVHPDLQDLAFPV